MIISGLRETVEVQKMTIRLLDASTRRGDRRTSTMREAIHLSLTEYVDVEFVIDGVTYLVNPTQIVFDAIEHAVVK